MPYLTWEESESALKALAKSGSSSSLSLLILENELRLKEVDFGNWKLTPMRRSMPVLIGTRHFVCTNPFSNLVLLSQLRESTIQDHLGDHFAPNIGLSVSTILSFVLRCTVVAYNDFSPAIRKHNGTLQLSHFGQSWANSWNSIFEVQEGLRSKYLRYYHPSAEEEKRLVSTFVNVYEKLTSLDYETYHSVMGALHLYQLAFFVGYEDLSLSYSLLVGAVDALAKNLRIKTTLSDIDPECKLAQAMDELDLEKETKDAVKERIVSGMSLTKAFCAFIRQYLPEAFWSGDHSLQSELDRIGEEYHTGQYLIDLAEYAPTIMKPDLLKMAEEEKNSYEEFRKAHPKIERRLPFNDKNRELMLSYLKIYLEKVLTYTYAARSELFHFGKAFPRRTLKEQYKDWVPDIFEDDLNEFLLAHVGHRWEYKLSPKGRITRRCSCGNIKEIRIVLGIRVFEKIVHDSILNYVLTLDAK